MRNAVTIKDNYHGDVTWEATIIKFTVCTNCCFTCSATISGKMF